jgi:hypothetical protein
MLNQQTIQPSRICANIAFSSTRIWYLDCVRILRKNTSERPHPPLPAATPSTISSLRHDPINTTMRRRGKTSSLPKREALIAELVRHPASACRSPPAIPHRHQPITSTIKHHNQPVLHRHPPISTNNIAI